MTRPPAVDHVVIAAANLDQGARWCESVLHAVPAGGGRHPLMGTHNRLLRIDGPDHPHCYLEVIAIDPDAPPPGRARWFGMDAAALRQRLEESPLLLHFAARVPDASAVLTQWRERGIDAGRLLDAERATPAGLLRWRIAVRDDGSLPLGGMLPTLIEWGDVHPAEAMARSAVSLQAVQVSHPRSADLRAALDIAGLGALDVRTGPPKLTLDLATPAGTVRLES